MMIVLVRHATPCIDYGRCGYTEAVQRMREYNSTELVEETEVQQYKEAVRELLKGTRTKYHVSSLPRAITTAESLLGVHREHMEIDDAYREFALRVWPVRGLKLTVRGWFAISRIAWILRLNGCGASPSEERARATSVAERLVEEEKGGSAPVLVGHGLLNRLVGRDLGKHGFKRVNRSRSGSFEVVVFDA